MCGARGLGEGGESGGADRCGDPGLLSPAAPSTFAPTRRDPTRRAETKKLQPGLKSELGKLQRVPAESFPTAGWRLGPVLRDSPAVPPSWAWLMISGSPLRSRGLRRAEREFERGGFSGHSWKCSGQGLAKLRAGAGRCLGAVPGSGLEPGGRDPSLSTAVDARRGQGAQ